MNYTSYFNELGTAYKGAVILVSSYANRNKEYCFSNDKELFLKFIMKYNAIHEYGHFLFYYENGNKDAGKVEEDKVNLFAALFWNQIDNDFYEEMKTAVKEKYEQMKSMGLADLSGLPFSKIQDDIALYNQFQLESILDAMKTTDNKCLTLDDFIKREYSNVLDVNDYERINQIYTASNMLRSTFIESIQTFTDLFWSIFVKDKNLKNVLFIWSSKPDKDFFLQSNTIVYDLVDKNE